MIHACIDSLHFLKKAWDSISAQTIINCFTEVKFIHNDGPTDDPPDIQEYINNEEEEEEFEDDHSATCAD